MSYPSLYHVYGILLLTSPTLAIGIVDTFSTTVQKQSRIMQVSESSFVRSHLECSKICAVKGDCMGYNYNKSDRFCEFIVVSYGFAQDDSTFKHVPLKGGCISGILSVLKSNKLERDFQISEHH